MPKGRRTAKRAVKPIPPITVVVDLPVPVEVVPVVTIPDLPGVKAEATLAEKGKRILIQIRDFLGGPA